VDGAPGAGFRRRFDGSEPLDHADLLDLAGRGMIDYVVEPMRFRDGQVHAITFATDRPEGFSEEQVARIRHINRPLSRMAEILALRRTATNLLSAYVGRDAGERILKGQIQRGDVEDIRCVVWFSDLRGFTRMSAQKESPAIIAILNRLFDSQIPAVERGGGQVLKFMGDGMLAIFPISEAGQEAEVAARALQAAREAFAALDQTNAGSSDTPLAFGIALHVGEVAYGNIGGVARLDFTCIGKAVNLAARIEGLTGPLGWRLLLSAELAALLPDQTRSVGHFPLKGVEGEAEVFEVRGG
jgi:adenylate cyclase